MTPHQTKIILCSVTFVGVTAAAVAASGRSDAAALGALFGLLLAGAWNLLVLDPSEVEKKLGIERTELNLATFGLVPSQLRLRRWIFAAGILSLWLAVVLPPLIAPTARAYAWVERHLRAEQAILRIEFPSYLDSAPKELQLKGEMPSELEIDSETFVSLLFRYRKPDSQWQVNFTAADNANAQISQPLPASLGFGHSARSLLEQLSLDPKSEHSLQVSLQRDGKPYAKQKLKIIPQPRPKVELTRSQSGQQREGSVPLDVKVRSEIPLASVEFQVRTASGYRMAKPIAEFANANEQNFDGQAVAFSILGIPFTPKDTLFVKAVARTVAENVQGESEELKFDIVTRESMRQDLMQALEKALQALQSNAQTASSLKEILSKELSKAEQAAKQMGQQSLAAKQMEKIAASADKINAPHDKSARETEQKIKNLLERLKREQTANQIQNLLARLQNLKFSIQRANPEQLPQLSKDANELRNAAESLKKQLNTMVEKPTSALSLQEKQAALDALKMDHTPENLKDLEKTLAAGKQTDAMNKSQSTLEHAQKNLGGVLAMLQAARQRAMREAREKLTRADGELQNARKRDNSSKDALGKSQQDLDSLPQISDEFQDAARDAQKGNQKARQGSQNGSQQQVESGIEEAQDGIVRALAALQDEEESERQSQQEQDGQSFRSAQEALAAQGQLDMGWRRQILEEIARLRAKGEAADSPSIQYLESRLR